MAADEKLRDFLRLRAHLLSAREYLAAGMPLQADGLLCVCEEIIFDWLKKLAAESANEELRAEVKRILAERWTRTQPPEEEQ